MQLNNLGRNDFKLKIGHRLIIPASTVCHDQANQYRSESAMNSLLMGSFLPHIVAKPPKQHQNWLVTAIVIIVIIVIANYAPHLAQPLYEAATATAWASATTAEMTMAFVAAGVIADIGIQGVEMAAGMQHGFSVQELAVAAITAGFDGYLNASAITAARSAEKAGRTVEALSKIERMVQVAESVILRQLSEMALNLRSKFDFTSAGIAVAAAYVNEEVNEKLDAKLDPKVATTGDYVANRVTAAAVSTAMAQLLGSAIKHQPLDAANLAANTIGAAVGTGLGATFADKLDAQYQQTGKGTEYTKQSRKQAASERPQTAAEQHMPGAKPTAKPKVKTSVYNPANDPIIQEAEATAKTKLPGAGLDTSSQYVSKQQAAYNSSAAQHENWKVDHRVMGGLERSWHYIKDRVKSYKHFYDNYIVPTVQGLEAATSGPFSNAPTLSLALNVGAPIAANTANLHNTIATNYRNFVKMDANDKTFTLITGAYNAAEQVATIAASDGIASVSKLGMFAAATKAATAVKAATALKATSLGKGLSAASMFAGTVKGGKSVEALANKAINRVKIAQENFSATSPNAANALTRKYKALEGAQTGSVRAETLSDGRIKYYDLETPSAKPGPTRGSAYVTEYNPKTGDVYSYMESYDQLGNVNRIHPKMYNGQTLQSPHFPPTLKDKLEAELYKGYGR